jgi:cyclopropane-fatty-acyl-phospholipid synthase
MTLLSIEHGRAAYVADYALYAVAIVALATMLWVIGPRGDALSIVCDVAAGLLGWSLAEYLLHRFVLHGMAPFRHWHATHHARPVALVSTPTVLSAALFAGLVFLPIAVLAGRWPAAAVTLGALIGYFAYALTHHATHHWRAENAWLMRRKRWHALHHHVTGRPGYYGVTTGIWDRLFGTAPRHATARPAADAAGASIDRQEGRR